MSYHLTCCSRAAAHIAQAIVLLKFIPEEIGAEMIETLKPLIKRTEKLITL